MLNPPTHPAYQYHGRPQGDQARREGARSGGKARDCQSSSCFIRGRARRVVHLGASPDPSPSHRYPILQKNLTEAHKSLDQAIRASASAFKDEEKAYAQQEKASKLENRAYHETKHLEHKHENALKDQQTSQQQMELAKQHHDQLNAEVQAKKGLLDEVTSRHHELVVSPSRACPRVSSPLPQIELTAGALLMVPAVE